LLVGRVVAEAPRRSIQIGATAVVLVPLTLLLAALFLPKIPLAAILLLVAIVAISVVPIGIEFLRARSKKRDERYDDDMPIVARGVELRLQANGRRGRTDDSDPHRGKDAGREIRQRVVP